MLDLVQPLAAGRQFRGFDGEARRDEPGREGTLQHAEQIKLDNGDCNLMGRRWLSLECVSCFTLGPARTFYRREITEQSVMVVGLLLYVVRAFRTVGLAI